MSTSKWPLVVSRGGYNYPDYSATSAGSGDHKVAVDEDDANADYLFYKLESDTSILLTDDGHDKVMAAVSFGTALPLPDGVASVGDPSDKTSARESHVHPLTPPDTYGGKLWTAYVPDPLLHSAVDAQFCDESGCAPHLFVHWTQIATGVWQKDVAGHMTAGMTDNVEAFVGMRVLAWAGNLSSGERIATGIYVITDIGQDPVTHADTFAQMQRADDFKTSAQALSGSHVLITGGDVYAGMTVQLTTSDPIELDVIPLTWEIVSAPALTPTYELLTAAQLSLAGPNTNQATAFAKASSGEVELQIFTEHDTALGGQTIPSDGVIRFHVPAFLWEDDPDADTVVHCYLRAHAAGQDEAWVPVAVTQALHNTELGVWLATGTMGADYPIPIGSYLQARYTVTSTSTAGINLNFVYNDSAHSSYIELPLTVGFAGTDYHPDLSGRALPDQHPASAITPATAPDVTTVAGFLTLPSDYTSVVLLHGSEPLLGISSRSGGHESLPLILFIMEATTTDPNNAERDLFRVLTNGADMAGHSGFSAMNFGMMGMGKAASDNLPPNYELTMYSSIQLICMVGVWRPVAPAFVYQSP